MEFPSSRERKGKVVDESELQPRLIAQEGGGGKRAKRGGGIWRAFLLSLPLSPLVDYQSLLQPLPTVTMDTDVLSPLAQIHFFAPELGYPSSLQEMTLDHDVIPLAHVPFIDL
jgi:hypothetical protein